MLVVKDLHVHYGQIEALQGTSLEVREGEIVGLVGHNGAGKSTTLKTIVGLLSPSSGEITFEGRSIANDPNGSVRQGIAYVPEDRRIFSSLTVGENLRIGATIRSDRAAIEEDIEQQLKRFPFLGQYLDTGAGKLSGGQQQMLAISRAILSRPRLILLDEPTLGLAPLMIDQIFDIVRELREGGATVLLVEQNVARTIEVADRTYVMSAGGRVEHEGTEEELRAVPAFTREYLGL